MRFFKLLAALITVCGHAIFLGNGIAGEDWPTWQHDNQRTGSTTETLDTEALRHSWTWKSPSPPQTAWAGPAKYDAYAYHRNLPSMRNYDSVFHMIAINNRVYFGSSVDDSLYCLNATSGEQRWAVTTCGPVRLAPTWSSGRIYFGSDDGFARCVDADSGRLIWKFSPSRENRLVLNNGRMISFQPCRTGVVVDDKTAWFACAMLPWKDSFLCAVDAKSGKVQRDGTFVKKLPGRTMEGPPALSSSALILPQGRVSPRVFDRETGDDLGEMAKSGGGSVVVVSLGDKILHGPATDTRKGGFRQSSGESREMVAAMGRGNALVVDKNVSWMLTDDEIVASSLSGQEDLWSAPCDCPFAMIKAGETLYVGGDNRVAAYSARDGKRIWSQKADGRVFGLVAAHGRLFASSDTGAIQCYAPSGDASQISETTNIADLAANESDDVVDLEPVDDPRLLGHWAFQNSSSVGNKVRALQGPDLTLAARGRFSRLIDHQAMEFDGSKESAMVAPAFQDAPHPQNAFTAEAWVRIDQMQTWGGIIGIVQDDGSDEKGWLLGYRKDRFCVAVCGRDGPGKLTYLTADHSFDLESWHHVAGTYDGDVMKLFVDGKLCAESAEQSGEIRYPDRAWFEIAAYHDKNEYHRMTGAIHEVRLYDKALNSNEIQTHYQESSSRIPRPVKQMELASGPWLKFTDPSTAVVRWTTSTQQPTRLEFGESDFEQIVDDPGARVDDPGARREHSAVMTRLRRNIVYQYRIGQTDGESLQFTKTFECDNFFNYTAHLPTEKQPGKISKSESETVALIRKSEHKRGISLVLGKISAAALIQCCHQSEMRFILASDDPEFVTDLRRQLRDSDVYGHRVAVHHVNDLAKLPFPANWANVVIVAEPSLGEKVIAEAKRQARPDGGIAFVSLSGNANWFQYVKPALPGSADWSHLYGTPANAAFAGERLAGVKSAEEMEVQWVGRPGPRYQADRSGRKPSPLAIGGRLFLQGLGRIIAVDSFNGSILWSVEIPSMERFNMPRDCSNWCGDDDHLYVAVKGECWKIRTRDGEVVQRIPAADPDSAQAMDWGFVATDDGGKLFGSTVRQGTSWTSFWGGGDAGWYDARSGSVTHPICSDTLFCRNPETSELKWEYRRGVVMNPTVTVGGNTIYFVESRNQKIIESSERRMGNPEFWKELYLVAIDTETGSQRWEKQLGEMDPQVVLYLAHAANQLIMVGSSNKSYEVVSYSGDDGSQKWRQSTSWPGGKGDHGKAMMRPAIAGDKIFLRPYVFSLRDGKVLPEKMPDGHGCGTYACSSNAIFYRAKTVTMWNADSDKKSTWPRLRPDCWLSTIPANGMLLSPEGGGGCSCGSWMETSIGFMPKRFENQ